jgi:hypothetical protein
LYLFCPARFDASLAKRPLYQEVFENLDLKLPFIIEFKLAKNMGYPKLADFR